jgi:asparagine synthase (glutamine-hydrolysing)
MCGIAAIFNYATGEPVKRGQMGRMLTQMQRRGPDGSGEWYGPQDAVGLGHRRLSIIDLSSAGAQPMVSCDGTCIVTFNGEIYNYRELRADLENRGRRFRSQSDTEILLHLYQLEGEAMLPKLRGMFAFAIWDGARRGLFMARDPLGIKPLYFADDGRTIRVASQVKALLAAGEVDAAPEPAGHVGFFLWGHVPSPYTLYRGIRALSSGSSLWVDRAGVKMRRPFFDLPRIFAEAEGQTTDLRPPTSDLLGSSLRDSVQHHLVADVPVGVFLSSGLDSTTLAALAAETGVQLRTITLGFEEYQGRPNDETPLAEAVARHYGAQHQTIWVRRKDFENDFHRLLAAMDQPSCDGVNSYFISKAAAQAGLKVALSGVGGDELFGGYPSFREIPRAVAALGPFSRCQPAGRAFQLVAAPFLKRMTSPKYAGLLEYGGTYGGAYLLRRGMFMPWELPDLLDADLVREGWQKLRTIARLDATARHIRSPHLKIAALEMNWYLRCQLLPDTDWASMDHSLEVRTPLVDSRLLRTLAPWFACGSHPTKRDMALTPRRRLPDAVLNRSKTGFTVPVRDWLMQDKNAGDAGRGNSLERGLRGWTRLIYSAHLSGRVDSAARSDSAPFSVSRIAGRQKILIFRIGQLGDTVAALPAMWAIRNHFQEAELTLLCDRHPDKNYVFGPDLLRSSGLFQKFEFYPVRESGLNPLRRSRDLVRLLSSLRKSRYDALVYLAPSTRTRLQVQRDRSFFRLAGIKQFMGVEGFSTDPGRVAGRALEAVPHESDLLLARLAASDIPVPRPGRGCMALGLGAAEQSEVRNWLGKLPPDGGRPWIAFGPGSKMPAKRWPLERFAEVGRDLIKKHDVWPVVFGGAEDREMSGQLLQIWGRGHNAAGQLSLRGAAEALNSCLLYIGNDTGTMHLAAAAGVRCVAVFSARDHPGRWHPYGEGHKVLRTQIDCEGCGLVECVERKNECLNRISAEQVLQACEALLKLKQ